MYMILVSHSIIDPYDFNKEFLVELAKYDKVELREVLEFIYFNKNNQNKSLNKKNFMELFDR